MTENVSLPHILPVSDALLDTGFEALENQKQNFNVYRYPTHFLIPVSKTPSEAIFLTVESGFQGTRILASGRLKAALAHAWPVVSFAVVSGAAVRPHRRHTPSNTTPPLPLAPLCLCQNCGNGKLHGPTTLRARRVATSVAGRCAKTFFTKERTIDGAH
jgi:hypothetical protein